MARPASLVDKVRLHLYGPDATTSRGTISADGSSGLHSKDLDGSALSFTANALETVLAADPTLLDDAFAVPERYISGAWSAFGTPYQLSPGGGTVYGQAEASAAEQAPKAVGALFGLLNECLILPTEPDTSSVTFRYAGGIEQNRYIGWMSKGYDETGDDWHDATVYTPTSSQPKYNKPAHWPDPAASWVYRDPALSSGSLTLVRFGTFTLTTDKRVHFASVADENHKIYLDGPNCGGCIIDSSSDEDGYNDEPSYWSRRLKAGTYRVSGEFRTINSEGGDGNDSIRFTCYTFDAPSLSGDREDPQILLRSKATTRVRRQSSTVDRPGMSVGETVRRLLADNVTLSVTAASLLTTNRTFTDANDSSSTAWPDGREWVFPLGSSLAAAISDMQEDADFDMGPTFAFNAWADRGSDISATVAFTPGGTTPDAAMNIEGETFDSDPAGPNAYLTQSQQGFDYRAGTVPTGSRRRLGFLELGTAGSIARARRLADAAIRQNRYPRRYYSYAVMQVTGAVFYTNVNLCDVVNGRNYRKLAEDQEVTALGWSVSGDLATFTAETTEIT